LISLGLTAPDCPFPAFEEDALMSVETVISIVKAGVETVSATPTGPGRITQINQILEFYRAMPYADFLKMHRAQDASRYFKGMPGRITAWMNRISQLRASGSSSYLADLVASSRGDVAFQSALNRLAAQEVALSTAAANASQLPQHLLFSEFDVVVRPSGQTDHAKSYPGEGSRYPFESCTADNHYPVQSQRQGCIQRTSREACREEYGSACRVVQSKLPIVRP
jgi:hypothetical protein